MKHRCSKCHAVVTDEQWVEWRWPVGWFHVGEKSAKSLATIGKKIKPVKRRYHWKYGKRRGGWEAFGPKELCGEIRESHPDEDAFDHLLTLMRRR